MLFIILFVLSTSFNLTSTCIILNRSVCASQTTSLTAAVFCSLSSTTMCRWLVSSCLSVWNLKFDRILALLFTTAFGGISHWDLGTLSPYATQMFVYTIPATWLWLYCMQPQRTSYILLLCVRDSQGSSFAQYATRGLLAVVVDLVTVDLTIKACSCAAVIRASVLSVRLTVASHW